MFDEMFGGAPGISRNMLLSAVFCDFRNNIYEAVLGAGETQLDKAKLETWLKYKLPVDDIDDFIERVRKPTHYIHVTGSVNGLAADLKVFAEYLLTGWGNDGTVTFVAKDERVGPDATIGDIEALLATDEFSRLRKLRDEGRFKIVSSGSKSPGVNFRTISGEFRSSLDEVSNNRAVLGIKGETNNFTSNLINYEHFRFLLSRDIETRRMMGVFWDVNETESPIPVVLRVPAGIAIADRWVKALFATQFYRARNEFEKSGNPDYDAARKTIAQTGLSFVEVAYPEALFLPAKYEGLEEEYSKADKEHFPTLLSYARYKRQELFNGIAASIIGRSNYRGEIYSLEGDGRTLGISSIEKGAGRFKANVLVSGGIFDPKAWDIGTVRAGDIDTAYADSRRTLVSHDWVFNNVEGARVSINALYFFTPTLLNIYNRYRQDRPEERIEDVNFYIDAFRTEEGYENGPLYNKAYFGIDDSGNLIFGRRRLLGGTMTINGKEVRWAETQVVDSPDKVPPAEDVLIYTPMMAKSDASISNRDNGYTIPVGEGRINLIIINNKIKAIVKGDVLLPSVGIVVSLSEGKFKEIFGEDASKFDGRRFSGKLPEASFKFDWPENTPTPRWYLGGGTMLVMDGENLVADKTAEIKNFTEEGWFNLLSMQTQETQVQDWVRGPRMVLGTTKNGKMFAFSFSGRSALYSGVNFAEAIEIIKRELAERGEEIQNAINLDGGSSVAFNVKGDDGKIYTTSWPAVGPDNAEGLRRPVSGCVYFIDKDNLALTKKKLQYENWWRGVNLDFITESVNGKEEKDGLRKRWENGKKNSGQEHSSGYGVSMVGFLSDDSPLYRNIRTIQEALERTRVYSNGKLILNPPKNIHFTIFGLETGPARIGRGETGDISPDRLRQLHKIARTAIQKSGVGAVNLSYENDIGISPSARINVQGFAHDNSLEQLRNSIKEALNSEKIPVEDPKGEHITIATITEPLGQEEFDELKAEIERLQSEFEGPNASLGNLVIDRVTLVHHNNDLLEGNLQEFDLITYLSNLKLTSVLFLDEEVVQNPSGFKAALEQLNTGQNMPVILLTQETEQSVRDKLKDISLEGVRFRTLAQLGLQDFRLDEVMSLIAGIDDIRCIPLTDSLTDVYEALKKARDQV